ncbi:MAG: amidophosphoribosyltransferase [Myxococcales bacterium]|nr:amidophosphoribosyltransferase [Myxococcales bacterium]MCB9534408.1 amidophosphoribosyltransferase [Myxococcales bacterium]
MCGVIGVYSELGEDVVGPILEGLFQMQHRGQDACGVAVSDGKRIALRKDVGYVRHVFPTPPTTLPGAVGCGHVRYPTAGGNRVQNAQPHVVPALVGAPMGLASNGDITNYAEARAELEAAGVAFAGTNDAELIVNTIAFEHHVRGLSLVDAIRAAQRRLRGAYSSVLVTQDRMFAIRDPNAIRPLTFGYGEGRWIVASESSALDTNFADRVDDVAPGEIIEFGPSGMVRHPSPDVDAARGRSKPAHCAFEFVYFSRPDSITFGRRVYDVRKRIGAWLAADDPVEVDVVVPVPDSSTSIAMGYGQERGVPFELGLIRNHYVGRTFISPDQTRRDEGVRQKFNPIRSVFKGRRVALVDDSIVRGTTLRKLVRMVRSQGATEVHVRIGSPVTKFPCFYGVDTPDAGELVGSTNSVYQIREMIEADTLRYMTTEGLASCIRAEGDFCFACFDGSYPVPLTEAKFERGTAS